MNDEQTLKMSILGLTLQQYDNVDDAINAAQRALDFVYGERPKTSTKRSQALCVLAEYINQCKRGEKISTARASDTLFGSQRPVKMSEANKFLLRNGYIEKIGRGPRTGWRILKDVDDLPYNTVRLRRA